MNKALPIIIAIVAIVAVGFIAWNFLGKGEVSVPVPGVEVKKEAGEEGETFVGKLKDMVARGASLKCSYTQNGFTGTSYIKNKKVYGEVTGENKTGYVIMIDKCMWSWSEGEAQGVKMCFEEDVWEEEEDGAAPTEAEYSCIPAIVSDSKFNPPANVNFMEMGEMMEEMMGE